MKKLLIICLVLMFCLSGFVMTSPVKGGSRATNTESMDRTVLVECFTGTWCPPCQGAEGALDRLADEYPRTQLTIIEWHCNEDEKGSPNYEAVDGSGEERASDFYDIKDYPTAYFDGVKRYTGGSSDPDDNSIYETYNARIESRLETSSPLTIRTSGYIQNNEATVNAEITAVDTISASNLYVYFVLYNDEDENITVDDREYRLRYTALKTQTSPISIEKGETKTKHETFQLDESWDHEKLGVVTFVQTHDKDTTYESDESLGNRHGVTVAEVLQSDDLRFFTDLDVSLTPGVISKEITAGNTTTFNMEIKNTGGRTDIYEFSLVSEWSADYSVCTKTTCFLHPSTVELEPNEHRKVDITVTCPSSAQINDTSSLTFTIYSDTNANTYASATLTVTVTAAPVDSDGDGYTDAEEIAAGTDPNDPNDYPGAGGEETEEKKKGFIPGFDIGVLIFALGIIFMFRKRFFNENK